MLQRKIEQRNNFIDRHFGERARKRIRKTIRNHNEKLVEYQAPQPVIYQSYPPFTNATPSELGIEPVTPAEPSTAPPLSSAPPPAPDSDLALPEGTAQPRIASEPPVTTADEAPVSRAPAARPTPSAPPPTSTQKGEEYGSIPNDIDLAF